MAVFVRAVSVVVVQGSAGSSVMSLMCGSTIHRLRAFASSTTEKELQG